MIALRHANFTAHLRLFSHFHIGNMLWPEHCTAPFFLRFEPSKTHIRTRFRHNGAKNQGRASSLIQGDI